MIIDSLCNGNSWGCEVYSAQWYNNELYYAGSMTNYMGQKAYSHKVGFVNARTDTEMHCYTSRTDETSFSNNVKGVYYSQDDRSYLSQAVYGGGAGYEIVEYFMGPDNLLYDGNAVNYARNTVSNPLNLRLYTDSVASAYC